MDRQRKKKLIEDEATPTKANVIILAGQSNAYGASPYTTAVKSAVAGEDYSNIKIHYNNINCEAGANNILNWRTFFSNNDFQDYYPALGGQAGTHFGPELGIAHQIAMADENADEAWYIIKFTAAGSNLNGGWYASTVDNGFPDVQNIKGSMGSYLTESMLAYVTADLAKIVEAHGAANVDVTSFVWMQGEADALHDRYANTYKAMEQQLVRDVRNVVSAYDSDGSVLFVDGAIAAYNSAYNSWTYAATVNGAKKNNCAQWYVAEPYALTSNNSAGITNSIGVDTSDLISKLQNSNENNENDGYHYCGDSMLKLGQRFGKAILGTMK